jgi:hypothetical protein
MHEGDHVHNDHNDDVGISIPHRDGKIKVEGYGVILRLTGKKAADVERLKAMLKEIVTEIARDCIEGGAMAIGHVKSHLKTPSGYVKADIVQLKQGAYAEGNVGKSERSGTLIINSIVLGLDKDRIAETTLEGTQKVLKKYSFSASIEVENQDFQLDSNENSNKKIEK